MTLQVYCKNQLEHYSLSMFFDLNGQEYIMFDGGDGNIFVTNGVDKIHVDLDIFHTYENKVELINSKKSPNTFCIIDAVSESAAQENIVFNDFLFNRTKAYYSQFPFNKDTKKWYNHGQLSYIIPTHPNAEIKNKIYVSPNKTYYNERKYRSQLVNLLKEQYLNVGYLGNYDTNPELFLYSHIEFPWVDNINELESTTRPMSYNWWGYCPPHNEYYKNTFISIYGETIEYGTSITVTEKTFDPLIKGHFILPFSTSGFIQNLKERYNFKFPDFIDYTYDKIIDDHLRYQTYEAEVKRLLALDLDIWKQNWSDNFDQVIRHNQLVFQEKSYDRINFYKLLEATK